MNISIGIDIFYKSYDGYLILYERVVVFATAAHKKQNQLYSGRPYPVHLKDVANVLARFDFDPATSELARKIHIAAWLHDTVEDTDVTLDEIREQFGDDVAKIVDAVTKVQSNSIDDVLATIIKVKQHPLAILVKLADRIANVEWGLKTGTILQKYLREYPLFKENLKEDGVADAMWAHLDSILISK